MVGDLGPDRDDLVVGRLGDRRLVAPVDGGGRQVEKHVDYARLAAGGSEQPVEQLAGLGPDAWQGRRGGE